MKPLLKLLARLYPSAWRARYGAEYEALLDDATPRPRDAFNILWGAIKLQLTSRSFVRVILPCAISGAIIAASITFAIQPRYVSQTLITVTESAPVTGDTLKQILLNLRDSTLNRDFVASVILKYNLYPRERTHMTLDGVIDKMLQSIEVRRLHASTDDQNRSGFAVYFVYSDPHVAQLVEGELISQFVRTNLIRALADPRQSSETLRVADAPSLPTNPIFPKRRIFALGGLVSGLLCGLLLAAILPTNHNATAAKG
jgi:LPS O-antigen subunit length determinant protein (WzzB/FepE family)